MKLKAQQDSLFSQGIDEEGIKQLEEQLKQTNVPQDKIEEIIESLKSAIPGNAPEAPAVPEEQEGVKPISDTTTTVLEPGKKLSFCDVCSETITEDVEIEAERLIDQGMGVDAALEQAIGKKMKHLALVQKYLAIWDEPYERPTDKEEPLPSVWGAEDVDIDDDDIERADIFPKKDKRKRRKRQDGEGKGKGMPGGLRRNKNTEECPKDGPGKGKGKGRGKGRFRMSDFLD